MGKFTTHGTLILALLAVATLLPCGAAAAAANGTATAGTGDSTVTLQQAGLKAASAPFNAKPPSPPPPVNTQPAYAWRWDGRAAGAIVCSVVISLIIAPGGSGGAQLYYPLFTALLGMPIRDTAAVVSFVMFLGSIVSCGMAIAERHPTDPERRPLIDYGSVLIVAPAVLLGVAFGVIANAILPLWLLQAASIGVFSWAFVRIAVPYLALRKRERARDAAAVAVAEDLRQVVVVTAAAGDKSTDERDDTTNSDKQPATAQTVRAAAVALVADALRTHSASAPPAPVNSPRCAAATKRISHASDDRTAEDLLTFCALDAQVHALEAAALDDYPLQGRVASGIFSGTHQAPETALVSAAVHAAVRSASIVASTGSPAALLALRANSAKFAAAITAGGDPKAAAPTAPAGDNTGDAPAPAVHPLAARLRAWAGRQPVLLISLTLAVLAQQLAFSILQRAVVAACTPGFYGLLAARVGVTGAITASVSVLVMRQLRREEASIDGPALNTPSSATADDKAVAIEEGIPPPSVAAAAKKATRAERRQARRAAEEAARLRNWEAIHWRPKDIATMNGAMLLIGVLGGCLGLGGGFAIAPLLLGMGIHPQCQAATSKAILFISTCAGSISFLISGRMPLVPALIFGAINLAVTPIGIIVMNRLIARTGRPSLLVALNALSYGAGVLLLLAMSGIPGWIATAQGRAPAGLQLQNLCAASS